jgi:endonuclease YncB( thermonuclease family)
MKHNLRLAIGIVGMFAALYILGMAMVAHAAPNPRTGKATVLPCHAIDGDTVRCGKKRTRAADYDTPERTSSCPAERVMAERAWHRLEDLVNPPNKFTRKFHKGADQYGRNVADFYSNGRKVTVDDFVIAGVPHAHPWSRKTGKQPWPGC